MSSTATPPKFTPPVSAKLSPAEMAIHLRQLYLITNQHDQAITLVNSKVGTSSSSSTDIDTTVAGVTSFNAESGIITFFPQLGQVNDQTGATAYTVQSSDDGKLIIVSDASPVTVTLDSTIVIPWFAFVTNQGTSVATLTPTSGTINGSASQAVAGGAFLTLFFDGTDWFSDSPGAAAGVARIIAGTNVTISPSGGTGTVTINATGGAVTQIVAGTNVTISPPGGTGAVTINASGSAINFADNETPSGAINGSNVTFTLANSPSPAGSLMLFLGGMLQAQGAGLDYTLSGATITFATAPNLGPLLAWYRY